MSIEKGESENAVENQTISTPKETQLEKQQEFNSILESCVISTYEYNGVANIVPLILPFPVSKSNTYLEDLKRGLTWGW